MNMIHSQKNQFIISFLILSAGLLISFTMIVSAASNQDNLQTVEVCSPRLSGLVSSWNGNRVSDKTVPDIGTALNNGNISDEVTIVPGKVNNAFKFDGSSGRIEIGNPESLNFKNESFSLEAWFMWDGKGDINNIIRKTGRPESGPITGYWLRISANRLEFYVQGVNGGGINKISVISTPVSPKNWHHVVATLYTGGIMNLYVDGQLKGTTRTEITDSAGEAPFTIGAWGIQSGVSEFFSGLISDISVYNKVMDAGEVQDLFNAGSGGKCVSSKNDIVFPVKELGSCKDEAACRAYCDLPENSRSCLAFVKKNNLLSDDEIKQWEKFIDITSSGGPGSCKNEKECINYCEDASHIVECTDFVEKYDLVTPQDFAEMQKVARALKAGAKLPGNCRNKSECISYCENSDHNDECLLFLEKAEFMTEKEIGLVRKFKGKSPGNCAKGKDSFVEAQLSCNAFCNDPTNQPICFRFLEEAGIMTAEEATQAGSLSDFQACIPSASQEIQQCFINNLGQDLYEAMKQGVLPLVGDIEDFMAKIRESRKCVDRYTNKTFSTFTDNPDALACISSELGKDYLDKAKRGEVKCGDAAQSQKKIESCIETAISAKLDRCFSLACSEAITCLKDFGNMDSKEQEKETDSDLNSKIKNKINSCVLEEIRVCLAKDCSEMTACMNKFQGDGEKEQEGSDTAIESEINAKMRACTKTQEQNQESLPEREMQTEQSRQQIPQQAPQGTTQSGGQIPQEYCSGFASTPSCSYVGSPDSDNYKYCKQCYPDK